MRLVVAVVFVGLVALVAVAHTVLDPRCPSCGQTHRHPSHAHRE